MALGVWKWMLAAAHLCWIWNVYERKNHDDYDDDLDHFHHYCMIADASFSSVFVACRPHRCLSCRLIYRHDDAVFVSAFSFHVAFFPCAFDGGVYVRTSPHCHWNRSHCHSRCHFAESSCSCACVFCCLCSAVCLFFVPSILVPFPRRLRYYSFVPPITVSSPFFI